MKSRSPQPQKPDKAIGAASGERALIAAIRDQAGNTRSSRSAVRVGIGDDCAIIRPPAGEEIVVTTDFSLEQVHFRRDWHPPESVGHRCLARGLSDLAATGARPLAAFLSLAIPPDLGAASERKSWVARFFDGLLALADRYKVPLAGGDTAQSPEFDCHGRKSAAMVSADIVLLGSVKRGRALLRSGARAGDVIYVTGELGGAAAELIAVGRNPDLFSEFTKAQENHPHLYPQPRVGTGLKLASAAKVHAAIDLSDGLSTDLLHVCEESGLAAELDAAAIPVHALAQQAETDGWIPSALGLALHGGEDYELLFTAPRWSKIPRKIAGVSIHPIGQMQSRRPRHPRVVLRERDGQAQALEPGGWEHFR
ncbi:MAG TPA: thiamine-phosphate kinase [Silvibacterium sp.]|nr:thiamine-phosphate kinase [Silvibacterium sp.]